MGDKRRDSTQEWLIPEPSRPPLMSELVKRIDEALATARASEAAVMTVGAAALDAAEQAKRAADLAEQASAAMTGGDKSASEMDREDDEGLRDFAARADRVAERLRELQHVPLSPVPASGVGALRQEAV